MKIALATFALLAVPQACPGVPRVFRWPRFAANQAAQMGILALLVVTVGMLASIAGFFFVYLRRRIRLFEESNKRELLDA